MPKISAILPIYNAGEYLRECLDSILAQTLEDIEVVCVNDGSTDDSLAIMEEYAAKDPRVKVCDYPNGGYGKAMNRGLSQATGEYISIVEPDDFIDAYMYEALYAHTDVEGLPVDVVKGSYWEYFDASNEADAMLVRPAIDYCMPDVVQAFSLAADAEVFRHHPSIWSAIYRKAFLDEKQITFVEPKGAGWADNPFLAATLSLASLICWVPIRGYFYRQTNVNASSYLKDYHIPFDRLREMREVLARADANEKVLAAFYERELNYIYDVTNTFGFDETDPEISALIDEVLADMRPDVVEGGEYVTPNNVEYFHMKTQPGRGAVAHEPDAAPLITLLLPVGEGGVRLSSVLASISGSSTCQLECLCLCDVKSGTYARYCEEFSQIDKRFSVVHGADFAEAFNGALAAARGTYLMVIRPGWQIEEEAFEGMATALSAGNVPDFMVLLPENPHHDVVDLPAKGQASPRIELCDDEEGLKSAHSASVPFVLSRISDTFVDWVAKRQLAEGEVFAGKGTSDMLVFAAHLLAKAETAGYIAQCQVQGLKEPKMKAAEPYPSQFGFVVAHRPTKTEAALAIAALFEGREEPGLEAGCAQLVLKAFLRDLDSARAWDEAKEINDEYAPKVAQLLDKVEDPCFSVTDAEALNSFEYLRARGLEAFYFKKYILVDNGRIQLEHELTDLRESTTFKVGAKVVAGVKKLLPSGIANRLRHR